MSRDERSSFPRVVSEATDSAAIRILERGAIEVLGALPNASNHTFLARVTDGDAAVRAVYKPRDGESPLWDFPDGTLWQREIAAWHVSERLGFGFVPPTLAREGPYGIGSVQLFVDHDPSMHYLNMPPEFDDLFRLVCLFDLLINNADRKAGHCLLDPKTSRIWMVDHGVSFHEDTKVRTVIWDFAGEPMPPVGLDAVRRFCADVAADPGPLEALLSRDELVALGRRAERVVAAGVFPDPGPGRPFPWPPV